MADSNYQNPQNQYYQQYQQQQYQQPPRKHGLTWLWVTLLIVAAIVALVWWLSTLPAKVVGESNMQAEYTPQPYIATLYVEGGMYVEGGVNELALAGGGYDHEYLLNTLDMLMEDEYNAGLLLYINSPGGSVLAIDELSRKVAEYKALTGRPVYAFGYEYAASGGYWLASTADHITLNTYCMTGSIGITMGALVDISGLLETYGVKTYNLSSGDEKNAANGLSPVSEETLAVYQGIIDEYYEDFLNWVAAGRGLSKETLRPLADGRIYTARQAVQHRLADSIGDYEDALADLMEQTGEIAVYDYYPTEAVNIFRLFFGAEQKDPELQAILELLPPSGAVAIYDGAW